MEVMLSYILLHPLTLGESQLMQPIDIINRPRRISNDAWILRSRRKRLFEKTILPGNGIREEKVWWEAL